MQADQGVDVVPARTALGRAEIESRSCRISGGLRSVLLLVDGCRRSQELRDIAARLDAPGDALEQLLALSLIRSHTQQGRQPAPDATSEAAASHRDRRGILYALMTEQIREHLGVRGYLLQLKLERAADDAALDALLPALQLALERQNGPEGAASAVARIRAAADVAQAA